MASSDGKPNLTSEQLSVIVDYEKMGPRDLEENYDMLLGAGMAVPGPSSSNPHPGPGLNRHRRKKHRPLQYRPTDSRRPFQQNVTAEDRNNDPLAFTSVLPMNPSMSVSRDAPQDGRGGDCEPEEEGSSGRGTEGAVPSSQLRPALLGVTGIADIHRTLARQLEQATAVADNEHQPCPFCSYVFSNVVFLVRHLKYRHGINLEMQVGIPQDAAKEFPSPPSQRPPLGNQVLPSNDDAPAASGSGLVGAGGSEERDGDAGKNGYDAIPEPETGPSDQMKEGKSLELTNELMLQRMDQLMRPNLTPVNVDNPPRRPIIICDKCTRAFITAEDLEQHQKIHNITKTYECDHCHKLFQNPSSLKKHTKLHTDGKIYSCHHCDKSFAAAAYLKTHMRLHTKQKPFVCKHCGKAFAASGTLISHERIHINDKPYGCEFCGKRFRQGSHLNRHKIIHTNMKPHVCGKCNRAFADVANLRRHERIHNQDNPNVCAECGKSFINLSSLKKHERLHTNEKPYICRHCSKPFASSGNLISHERTHTNERPYICKECGKAFTQSSHLKAHMGTHSSDTLYVCKHCGRGFTQRSTLCVHERIHLNKKPYICKVCQRAFTQSSTLKAHIRTHTKEKAHVCKVCGKAFSARGNLRSHELIHTDEKPFKCGSCPKAFKQGSTLRAHERTHTKERPYVCRACGKAFADGSNLKAHTLRMHCKDPGLDLGLLQGSDLFANTLLAESSTESLDHDDSYQFDDLESEPIQSPVGIKIKKTLEGLTSMLRFSKEGYISPSDSSDQTLTPQSLLSSDDKPNNSDAEKSLSENIMETDSSRVCPSSLNHELQSSKTLQQFHPSHKPAGSVLDLSRCRRQLSGEVTVSQCQEELSDGELTFDEDDDDDDDLESLLVASEDNSEDYSELQHRQKDTEGSRNPQEFQREANLDFHRGFQLRDSRERVRHLHLRHKRVEEGSPSSTHPETHLHPENGNREAPAEQDTTFENSRPKKDTTLIAQGFLDCDDKAERLESPQFESPKIKQENSNCRQSLIDDLQLTRILPLNN